MNDQLVSVCVQIMNTEYRFSCPPQEREILLEASRYLEERLHAIRAGGKVLSSERIVVMAALNIAYDYLKLRQETAQTDQFVNGQLEELLAKVETALSKSPEMGV
jgi:cell division protein ZapA